MGWSENSYGSDDSSTVQEMNAETKATLETELKSWSASSAEELKAAETERQYKFSTPPDWKCIICKKSIYTNPVYQVYQCQTGQLACYTCSQSGRNCRECSKAVTPIRNFAVEDIMNSLVVTCKFSNLGCKDVIKYRDLESSKHEQNCSFAPMVCPMPGCNQGGVKSLLAQHLLAKHNISSQVDVVQQYPMHSIYGYSEGYPFGYTWNSKEFELGSSTALVLVRRMDSKELHLLRQESTTSGDKFQITSVAESCKRKYQLDVTISDVEQTYSLKSVSTSNMQQGGQLLVPKQPWDDTLKRRCIIYMAT